MLRSALSSWREYLTPVSHTSTFRETGEITPEEFVAAGDYLAYRFPTWQWSSAPDSKKKDFLPDDKQFLVTRHVPSHVRAATYLGADVDDDEEDVEGEDGWTTTHTAHNPYHVNSKDSHASKNETSVENDIDDLIESDAESDSNDGFYETGQNSSDTRQYDLYISYSTSYRVPKMYLVGFDSNGVPLTPNQMFEDISTDYRDKTATIEKAPFLADTTSVSIHPCRHATVMKVLMERAILAKRDKKSRDMSKLAKEVSKLGLKDNDHLDDEWEDVTHDPKIGETDNDEVLRVDQYLIIFLKFMSSVTPGIEHDYTMDAF